MCVFGGNVTIIAGLLAEAVQPASGGGLSLCRVKGFQFLGSCPASGGGARFHSAGHRVSPAVDAGLDC